MRLFFKQKPIALIDDALTRYGRDEFASPTRSTVPLISLLKHANGIWSSIAREIGAADWSDMHLEFRVKPPQGRGSASHTDVMLVQGNRAIAFEAKWTEDPYDRISKWLLQGPDPQNRSRVMNGWLSLLQPHATKKLHPYDFGASIYQMVHRAASACYAGQIPALAYIQFCPLPNNCHPDLTIMDDLAQLHSLLGVPDDFPFWLVEVLAKPNSAFEKLRNLPKGLPETGQIVRSAVCSGPLFEFTTVHLHRIRGLQVESARLSQFRANCATGF